MKQNKLESLVRGLFKQRNLLITLFALVTLVMLYFASQLRVDASFEKNIPLEHEYMKTYIQYQEEFGGANRVLVALEDKNGDIFNPAFFNALSEMTRKVQQIPAVSQPQVQSLYTPNTRYIEASEFGLEGGPVIYAEFNPAEEDPTKLANDFNIIKENILKAGIVGRLVANDFSAAMVTGQLLSQYNATDEEGNTSSVKADFVEVANALEQIRTDIESKYPDVNVKIIGFSKMIGDVSNGAEGVMMFFLIALTITAILVFWYSRSIKLTILPLFTSIIAVIWQLGILTALGYGIDPMSILVPFLIFAIGVSHGVQMINGVAHNVAEGKSAYDSAIIACAVLLVPGGIALISDTVGFLTLQLIEIDIIRELAITASIGVAVLILTNLILLPLLLSFSKFDESFIKATQAREVAREKWWTSLSKFAQKPMAIGLVLIGIVLGALGYWQSQHMKIGDLHAGAPALRQDSIYNLDTKYITENFSIGTDMISILAEVPNDGCTIYPVMKTIDDFQWHISNVTGVQSTISLPQVSKIVNGMLSENNLKWKVLTRDETILPETIGRIETSSGLLNSKCSVIPVLVFLNDHKAETIEKVVAATKAFIDSNTNEQVNFRLATGPVGVMAATNEAVEEAQLPMLFWVYAAVTLLCLISFRSVRGTICVILPLVVVSYLAQALMTWLQIGLTVATLPVIALGVGIGVDYGIYIFTRMVKFIRAGDPVSVAYFKTLKLTGNAVIFTGLTLAIGVSTWIFSDLQFQADMGILLTFMFLVNMLGAIILLPALAAVLYRK
ncbi:RND family transporter [Kangiella sp. HZ709]|uniref:efflux RND transporter permease subunit n=1 Tax=Kangiella sp. HZ709 TaxID=2666328 RepID=UPI0012AF805B|nr:MMPL family transporter [Kangiella sp. HZ709]MRX28517.1 MMPL family transporter [Kangiella sp. HZ709]